MTQVVNLILPFQFFPTRILPKKKGLGLSNLLLFQFFKNGFLHSQMTFMPELGLGTASLWKSPKFIRSSC